MTELEKAARQALEALEKIAELTGAQWALEQSYAGHLEAITALRQALADQALDKMADNERELGIQMQPADEPVCVDWDTKTDKPIMGYTRPQPAAWVALTDAERVAVQFEAHKKWLTPLEFMELHEAKLRKKNEGKA